MSKKNFKQNKKAKIATPKSTIKKEYTTTSNWTNNWFVKNYNFVVVGLFLIIALAYCYPVLEGKQLISSDMVAGDAAQNSVTENTTENYTPKWNNSMFSGMPSFNNPTYSNIYILSKSIYFIPKLLNHEYSFYLIFCLLLFSYALLLSFRTGKLIATLGAIAIAFSTFNIQSIEAGHYTKILNIAYLCGLLAGFNLIRQKKYLLGFIIFTLSLIFSLYSGHIQIIYYGIILLLLFSLYNFILYFKEKEFKHIVLSFTIFSVSLILSFLSSFQLLNMKVMTNETTRGGKSELISSDSNKDQNKGLDKDYAFSWSSGLNEYLTLLVPNFMGGISSNYLVQDENSKTRQAIASQPNPNEYVQYTSAYWGNQPFVGGPNYFGIIILLFFVMGIVLLKKEQSIILLIPWLLFAFMSLGKNFSSFNYFIFDHLPLYNKFRTPSMTFGVLQILTTVIACLGLKALFENVVNKTNEKKIIYTLIGTIGVVALMYLLPTVFGSFRAEKEAELPSWLLSALKQDRIAIMRADALRSLLFLALVAGTILLWLKSKIKKSYALIIIIFLVLIDLWNIDRRYLNEDKYEFKAEFNNQLLNDPLLSSVKANEKDVHYRVFNLIDQNPFNDSKTSFYFSHVGGYHPAKLIRYQELIENHLGKMNMGVIDMLNTKYIFFRNQQNGEPSVQLNTNACGNVWFVDTLVVLKDATAVMNSLSNFNPKVNAFVEATHSNIKQTKVYQKNNTDSIYLSNFKPDHLTYQSNSETDKFAVFSEVYYLNEDNDGWEAFIDGKKVPIERTNYTIIGIEIPKGKHIIELKIKDDKHNKRILIGGISQIFVLILIISLIIYYIYNTKKNKKQI